MAMEARETGSLIGSDKVEGTAVYGAVYAITGDLRDTVIGIGLFFVLGLFLLWRVPKEERLAPQPA